MLFALHPGIADSAVFVGLNAFLLEWLRAQATHTAIDESHLPAGLCRAILENQETARLLSALADAVDALSAEQRERVRVVAHEARSMRYVFGDLARAAPSVPEGLNAALKTLGARLYAQASKLVGVTQSCGESIMNHYIRYTVNPPAGNGNVCGVCGTDYLAQRRANVADATQWRSPYDHLLARNLYPLFSVHPENLLPTCRTCNEKAKLAKDLLRDAGGQRRACFDPWSESAERRTEMTVSLGDTAPILHLRMVGSSPAEQGKLDTWDDVYRIKERVEGEFTSLFEKIAEDIELTDLAAFRASLRTRVDAKYRTRHLTAYSFWRSRMFAAVLELPDEELEQLRALCAEAIESISSANAFGI